MTTIRRFVWSAALAAALPVALVAQQAPSNYYRVECVKVKPGKTAEFNAMLSGDFRKFEQSRVDSGAISAGIELHTVIPRGSAATCDYVFLTFYSGTPNVPLTADETAAALKKAGISSSLEEWRQEHDAVGYLVSNSINRSVLRVGGAKKDDYIVVNDMSVPNTSAWRAGEKKLWQPIFEDAVKDGAMDGWDVSVQFMPRGAKDGHSFSTADIYPNWQALYTFFGSSFDDRWKKIHPDIPIAQGIGQEHANDTIEHTVLYKVIAVVAASK